MNIEQEKKAFKLFQNLRNERFIWKKSERPDFIIFKGGNRIGIELTEIVNEATSGVKPISKYSLEDKIVKMVQSEFTSISNKKLLVMIQFKDHIEVKGKEIVALSKEVAKVIHSRSSLITKGSSWNHHIDSDLPDIIQWISFDYVPKINEHLWNAVRSKLDEPLEIRTVIKAIKRKEKELKHYKGKVTTVELLLVDGLLPTSWWGEFKLGDIGNTSFDKVFLLRNMERKIFELK